LGFIKQIAIAGLIVLVIISYPVYAYASELQAYSIASGFMIGLINALIGYRLNEKALSKSTRNFMVIVFGGMGIRMIVIAILLLSLLYIAKLDEVSLVASVFFFYMLFVALEINYLHKKQIKLKQESSDTVKA
jgi:hypothetical protein